MFWYPKTQQVDLEIPALRLEFYAVARGAFVGQKCFKLKPVVLCYKGVKREVKQKV